MKISLDMWRNLSRVADFHLQHGYRDLPQPWIASQRAMEATLPPGAAATVLHGEDLLVGSAEQAFIDRMLEGTIHPGKWQTLTPCFRRENQYDEWHLPYFMKLELIDYMPTGNARHRMNDMIAQAQAGFEMLLGTTLEAEPQTYLAKTDIGWDLMLRGVEIGSYGVRLFEGHCWVYGTGLAEPRFTQASGVPR